MDEPEPTGYAELWLAEMGAYVPEWADGGTVAPRERGFGMHLTQHERARRHGLRLDGERAARRA